MNKIALVPILVLLVLFKCYDKRNIAINKSKLNLLIMLWYVIGVSSCFSGIIFCVTNDLFTYNNLLNSQIFYILQCIFIYIPLFILIQSYNYRFDFYTITKTALVHIARINVVYQYMQIVCWYMLNFDLNHWLFNIVLNADRLWTSYAGKYIGSEYFVVLRPTAFNLDAAYLGLLMILGFCIDRNKIWKILYPLSCMLALSRSSVLVIGIISILQMYGALGNFSNLFKSKKGINHLIVSMALLVIIINNSYVEMQMAHIYDRFLYVLSGADGTNRHIGYLFDSISIALYELPVMQTFLGIGLNCAGVILSHHNQLLSYELNEFMLSNAWVIECDLANVLLGTGVVGLTVYIGLFSVIFLHSENDTRSIIISLLLLSFMYNFSNSTIFQLLLLLVFSCKVKNTQREISDERYCISRW